MQRFNTGETAESLKENYNPEGSILRKCQLRMLDMLLCIDSVCQQHSIPYFIDAGTLLGAVRHKGFIPWDDDVDVFVDRKYYRKLKQILISSEHNQYILQCHETDPGYMGRWMVLRDTKSEYLQNTNLHKIRKYRGVQVDIFPIDDVLPDFMAGISGRLQWNLVDKLIKHGCFELAKANFLFLDRVLFPLVLKTCSLFRHYDYYTLGVGTGYKMHLHKENIYPLSKIEFEGHLLSCPVNCAEELKSIYGNFSELPPIDKRDHHQADYLIWD